MGFNAVEQRSSAGSKEGIASFTMVKHISVVVPVYHGKQYIEKQIKQIEEAAACSNTAEPLFDIELIFANDDPGEQLRTNLTSAFIDIKVLNTDINRGVQGARIYGLDHASGDYIHFLDQDDEVSYDFYKSQLEKIGDADLIYCRCYNGNRQTYNNDRVFETAMDKGHIFNATPMISPGQALIKKSAIPDIWRKNILTHMGSDDHMLWLCMYAENAKVALNQDILFRHVINGSNYSLDVLKAYESDKEMAKVLIKSGLYDANENKLLRSLPDNNLKRRYRPQNHDQIVLYILSDLLMAEEHGNSVGDYLRNMGLAKIAIYGAGILGSRLKGILDRNGIEVRCFIDRNAEFISRDIPIYTLESLTGDFDGVILSIISGEDMVTEEIRKRISVPVMRIKDIVTELMLSEK